MFGAKFVLAEFSGFLVLLTNARVGRFAAFLAALLFLTALLAFVAGFALACVLGLFVGFASLAPR